MFDLFGPRYQTRVIIDDCVKAMQGMKGKSVNCCVTSPPYFGLRDYGHEGQIGLEETPDAFVAKMVEVFREVHRVLRDDGTLWLNLGDSYAGSGKGRWGDGSSQLDPNSKQATSKGTSEGKLVKSETPGLAQKQLIGIPWRVAFALQADGWYLRQEIIWHKPNPMPESVRDRCTKSHEQIFLLSKSPRYYFDSDAIKEPAIYGPRGSEFNTGKTGANKDRDWNKQRDSVKQGGFKGKGATPGTGQSAFRAMVDMRNKRDVWTVATAPFKGSHFATFPPKLIEPCILAGCPVDGVVLDPFGGSGTTAYTANAVGRHAILIDLNESVVEFTRNRLATL